MFKALYSDYATKRATFWLAHLRDVHWAELIPSALALIAFAQFAFFTVLTLNQPVIDMWGFRPAQTVISIPYMLRGEGWLATPMPILGEPWKIPLEFPLYQWLVALVVWATGVSVDASGRLISGLFAVGTIWPALMLANSAGLGRRFTLVLATLWLLAPLLIFWGRASLIETTSVFLSAAWLAFYVRFIAKRTAVEFFICLTFGMLAAAVKGTTFAGFAVLGAIYTCWFLWQQREQFPANFILALLASITVIGSLLTAVVWGAYADRLLVANPLAASLRLQSLATWYLGTHEDRFSWALWGWTVRDSAIPEALGIAWLVALVGFIRLNVRNYLLWLAVMMIAAYLSVFFLFPKLHIYHRYYHLEGALFLCAAAALVVEALLRRSSLEGYLVLSLIVVGQLWTFYRGEYSKILMSDLHKHPYYQASLAIKEATPPDSVIVVFGTGWGADLPYFSGRRGIVLANWFPIAAIRQVLFEERDRWFGGRKLGGVVDCSVYESQDIDSRLARIRDQLKREVTAKPITTNGSFVGQTRSSPGCQIYVSKPEG
jgi:hypothetical protein